MSPGHTQKNAVVEPEFATLYSQMHAMMAHIGLHENLKARILPEHVETTTKLENIMVYPQEENAKLQTMQNM